MTKENLFFKTLKRPQVILFVLFIIALIPRLINISFHSLHYDESSTALMISQSTYIEMFKKIFSIEGTPPLFFIFEKIFVDFVGINNEFSIRFLPMLAGVFSCILVFYIVREFSSLHNAILSFILVTCSNFFIYLSNEARCYSIFGFFLLINLLFLIKWIKTSKRTFLIGFLFSLFFFSQIHYYAFFWICSVLVCSFFLFRKQKKQIFIYSILILSVSYLLLTPFILNQSTHEVGSIRDDLKSNWLPGIFYSPIKVLIHAYLYKIKSLSDLTFKDFIAVLPSCIILSFSLFLFICKLIKRKCSTIEAIVFLPLLLTFTLHCLFGSFVPTVHPRYMAHFLILIFPFIVCQFDCYKKIRLSIIAILLLINVVALSNFYSTKTYYIEQYREVALFIDSYVHKNKIDSKIILSDFMNGHALSYNLKNYTFYIFSSFIDLDVVVKPYKFFLFGNTLYSDLYDLAYFPKSSPFIEKNIIREFKKGFLLVRYDNIQKINDIELSFAKNQITTLFLQKFNNSQGDLILYWWSINE